jgi:hypothetical protein
MTNKTHNLKIKLESVSRDIDAALILLEEVLIEQDGRGQSTLKQDIDYSEVERWLLERQGFKTFDEYDKWSSRVGAAVVTRIAYEWTGLKLTFPHVRKIAGECLTRVEVRL